MLENKRLDLQKYFYFEKPHVNAESVDVQKLKGRNNNVKHVFFNTH